jgi:hypothetical protein
MKASVVWNLAKSLSDAYAARRRLIRWVTNLPEEAAVKEHVKRTLLGPKRLKLPYLEFSGLMIFDMAFGRGGCSSRRIQFGELAAKLGTTMDLADDVVDRVETSTSGRNDFLQRLLETSITGETFGDVRLPHRAAYAMMRQLHVDVLSRDPERVKPVFGRLVDVNRRQSDEHDLDKLLELEVEAGALIFESIALLLELEQGIRLPTLRQTCRQIGAFGQLLDNWWDLQQDLSEGVNTVATAMIRRFEDTPNVRRDIGVLYRHRIDALMAEFPHFDDPISEAGLVTMKSLLQFKYRRGDVFGRLC